MSSSSSRGIERPRKSTTLLIVAASIPAFSDVRRLSDFITFCLQQSSERDRGIGVCPVCPTGLEHLDQKSEASTPAWSRLLRPRQASPTEKWQIPRKRRRTAPFSTRGIGAKARHSAASIHRTALDLSPNASRNRIQGLRLRNPDQQLDF
jgi:hypothetical protein